MNNPLHKLKSLRIPLKLFSTIVAYLNFHVKRREKLQGKVIIQTEKLEWQNMKHSELDLIHRHEEQTMAIFKQNNDFATESMFTLYTIKIIHRSNFSNCVTTFTKEILYNGRKDLTIFLPSQEEVLSYSLWRREISSVRAGGFVIFLQ